ncbi:MAG: putative rane protein 96 [Ramlibacter sp.]|jgi:conjugal transfer/type IV secretion protein DotA/TraY|nr:putative rane protein 96 [Ramlibacter sp.]
MSVSTYAPSRYGAHLPTGCAFTWRAAVDLLGYMLLALLAISPDLAFAQATNLDIGQIAGASGADDESRKLWRMLLGAFADNPFAALGTPDSLMGGMFLILNSCFFVVGVTYFSYGIVKGVVATAMEGEVLGKRQSVTWFPIRGIIGIAGSMPIFGGFNLMQAMLVYIMIVGVGAANMVMTKALDMTNQFQGMLQPAAFAPQGVTQGAKDIARQMFLSKVCATSHNESANAVIASGVSSPLVTQYSSDASNSMTDSRAAVVTHTISWGTPSMTDACGSISVSSSQRSANSVFGFRVASVDYAAYARVSAAAYSGWSAAIAQMDSQLTPMAQQWVNARRVALDQEDGRVPSIDVSQIDAVAMSAITTATQVGAAQAAAAGSGAITSTAMSNMRALGWAGIGSWYSTFAEANAALADAASSVQMGASKMPVAAGLALNSGSADAVNAAAAKIAEGESARGTGQNPTKTLLDSAIQDTGCGIATGAAGTATGNCSLGQGIVSAFIRGTTIGSGGGGNGSATSMDSSGLVNPIIAMKNVGDYLLTFASTLIAAGPIIELADKFGLAKVAGTVVGGAGGTAAGPGGTLAGAAMGNFVGGAVAVLKILAFTLLVAGAAMSVYIPLIPFITWMGALLAYAASMFEGLAGMSLHAVSHLESDGDGLGQRTSQGYLFWINALARPALMVIGFFAASALMIAIGTLQAHLFLPAMANVQGNSITGLMSVILFILVFAVMNVSLISGSMNLIYVITDQVIGFIGGSINSHLGREVEGKVNAAFMMAARVGPSAIAQTQGALAGRANQRGLPNASGAGGRGAQTATPRQIQNP